MNEPFEIHRRVGLYAGVATLCLLVAAGLGYVAYARPEPYLWIGTGVLALLAFVLLRGTVDARTPLFVADDHGVRLQTDDGWIGLLWDEMGEIRVEPRYGIRDDARVKVISLDGRKVYSTPVGFATTVGPDQAIAELARRRGPAAY
ncbi:hypothetical protein [Aeromicrobium sp. Leaf350]|uniref:hypothetical protein n=1 Tax=Aeromicrobium sp. Leaf350 TaxID=2876565 RepID=UPI001E5B9EE4|nr:hypothetical protein [Aeromicrobium sp. Leaf350]